MKILFTGASSFTGMWFVQELTKSGHQVHATFQHPLDFYTGIRGERVKQVSACCKCTFEASFGGERFFSLIGQQRWDLLCHHAADVTHYKSPSFDVAAALAKNTKNLSRVLSALKNQGCHKVLLTGSVFEPKEGSGSDNLRAVSPYGLSKGLTFEMFAFYTTLNQMKLGKFVIPNPFGAFEEGRFTTYLIQTWMQGKTASVNTPLYIRDNVPANLLAKAYVYFASQLSDSCEIEKFNPSCYVESQGDFTHRFAREMRIRLGIPCLFELKIQSDFSEPMTRFNTDHLSWPLLGLSENHVWDQLAKYYQSTYRA